MSNTNATPAAEGRTESARAAPPGTAPGTPPARTFVEGAMKLVEGATLILREPKLWPYVIAQIGIAAATLALGIYGAVKLVDWLAATYLAGWEGALWGTLWYVVAIPTYIVAVLTAVLGTQIVIVPIAGGPFNEMLSEQVEAHVTGRAPPSGSFGELLRDAVPIVWRSLTTVAYNVCVTLIFWPLNFVPAVGPFLYMIPLAHVKALEALDPTFGRRRMSLAEKRAWMAARRAPILGLGAAVVLGNFILPIVGTLIVVPAAAAGGTLLYLGDEPS